MTTQRTLDDLQDTVLEMRKVETDLEHFSQWHAGIGAHQRSSSPTGIIDHETLMERYCRAKQSYHHKRLEGMLVEKIGSFDEHNRFHVDIPTVQNDPKPEEQRERALKSITERVQRIDEQVGSLRDAYATISSKRRELEHMIRDVKAENKDSENPMLVDQDETDNDGSFVGFEENIASEESYVEELQNKKRKLQEQLSSIRKEREKLENSSKQKHRNLVLLHQETAALDKSRLEARVQELKEIKFFYDSLREVLEELGGVKILEVKEDSNMQLLILDVLMYDEFRVQIVLEVYRQAELKLVNAQWITKPVVYDPCRAQTTERYSLSMSPLDDLVEVAKTNLSPPHDVRFIVRETCARIRVHKNRVQELASLRQGVLSKVIGADQVVCSLNEGIVIVMRFYDNLLQVEQIVGVSGWDDKTADKILTTIREREPIELTPSAVVEIVRQEVEKLKQDGRDPRTPRLPKRKDASEPVTLLH